ncbi:hypothetical protein ACHAXR_009568 [Thalassiosira sp. AJA248-18]
MLLVDLQQPTLRRPALLRSAPYTQSLFDEMDEMMEISLATTTRFPRPSFSRRFGGDIHKEQLQLRRPLGFEVTQDEKEYKLAVHVPDVDAKDIDLQLDHNGRVLRLKGARTHEDGGMTVQSHFEKAVLLSPDVDTTKLAANMSGDTLTIAAPKIEQTAALFDSATNKKIEIKVKETTAALQDSVGASDVTTQNKAPTQLAGVENLKDETAVEEATQTVEGDKRWPARDFPY